MELGMIGLGRMGGNMVTRLETRRSRREGIRPRRRGDGLDARGAPRPARCAACVLADGAGRRAHRVDVPRAAGPRRGRATPSSTAATRTSATRNAARRGPRAAACSSSTRASRAGSGGEGRLLPDGRRRRRRGRAARAGFTALAPEDGYGMSAPRRRALHEDGAQRDRVRTDAGLRRGLRGAREVGVRPRPGEIAGIWRYGSVVRSWLLELLHAASSRRAPSSSRSGLRRRLGRGPLDDRGGDRRGRPGAGHHRGALRALRLAPGRVVRGEGERRAAQPVRRPRRQGGRAGRRRSDR